MITRLFHSTKFTCHANLQYRSFTSKFRRKFSQLMQIVKTCVAPFTKMHSVGFSEIIPYHVPWVVSYFSWTQRAHMSTRHPRLPHYLTCLSLLIPIKLHQLFFDTGVLSHVRDATPWRLDVIAKGDAPRIWYAEAPGDFPRPGHWVGGGTSLQLPFPEKLFRKAPRTAPLSVKATTCRQPVYHSGKPPRFELH